MGAVKDFYHDEIEAGMRGDRKERPILFSTEMVQAIIKSQKSETRRIVKNIPRLSDKIESTGKYLKESVTFRKSFCPYGKAGDILWVREAWTKVKLDSGAEIYEYRSLDLEGSGLKYKPSIHMPKAAARIWLEVTDVQVERLHEITTDGVMDEGVRVPVNDGRPVYVLGEKNGAINFVPKDKDPKDWTRDEIFKAFYAELWSRINGIESWYENPWVWVIRFKVLSLTGRPDHL